MPGTTEPAPLTDAEIERADIQIENYGNMDGAVARRALAELRARRAAEEAHRRSAGAFEAEAFALANFMARHIVGEKFAAGDETCRVCVEYAKSALAQVRAQAMEEAAGIMCEGCAVYGAPITENGRLVHCKPGDGALVVCDAAAIRAKAGEG